MRRPAEVIVSALLGAALAQVAVAPPARAAVRPAKPILYRYVIERERSRVTFTFRGPVLPFDAYFTVLEGEFRLGSGDPFQGGSGWLRVKTASLEAQDAAQEAMLERHVLEVKKFPVAELRVEKARAKGKPERQGRERDWDVRATGALKLHGVEKKVTLDFKLADTGTEIYVRGTGTLRLSDYGMSRPTVLGLVPGQDEVKVNVRLVAVPAPR